MLGQRKSALKPRAKQEGVVLLIALIMLVAMTLAGIALVRSVDTTNIIAGNMAFQQAATHASDSGTETAIAWLEINNVGITLQANSFANGYAASRQDPAIGQSWDSFWTNVLAPAGQVANVKFNCATFVPDPAGACLTDASGNTVSYTVQRLCNAVGDPVSPGVDCAVAQGAGSSAGSSKGGGVVALQYNSQVYYRITTRITGPRNTQSYVQAIVAM